MNDRQLLCFLTVAQTLNFSAAAKELFCTQPALSYQIRSLEQELNVTLLRRSTTHVELTEAGRVLLPQAQQLYRQLLTTRAALKPYTQGHRLVLRLPPILLQRDPIYPVLIQRLHTALPGYELTVDTTLPSVSLYQMLSAEADAAVFLPFAPLPPELRADSLLHNRCYLVAAPCHPLSAQSALHPDQLTGQQIFYEPIYRTVVQFLQQQLRPASVHWTETESYETVYSHLLSGNGLFLLTMRYTAFPADWYRPLHLSPPLPDTCLLTLQGDTRPEIRQLRQVFLSTYGEFREKY